MHHQPCEKPPVNFYADLFGGCDLSANAQKFYTRPVLETDPWFNPAALRLQRQRGLCGVVPSPAEVFPNLVSIQRGAVVCLDIFVCRAPRSAVPKFFICESICALVGFAVGSALAPRKRFASALRLLLQGSTTAALGSEYFLVHWFRLSQPRDSCASYQLLLLPIYGLAI